jgi:hypothetical protein
MFTKSNINSKIAFIVLIVLTLGAIFLIGENYKLTQKEIDGLSLGVGSIIENVTQERVLYQIDEGNGKIISSRLAISKDSTIFSLLEDFSKKENFKLESKEYKGMGMLVESIDGVKNGTDNKYWQYWVNGELPMVAADKKEVKKNDKIEWKFATAEF